MKISVITDISVFQFYGYIEYIEDISTNILKKKIGSLKLIKTYENIKKNSKNYIINNNRHFKVVL